MICTIYIHCNFLGSDSVDTSVSDTCSEAEAEPSVESDDDTGHQSEPGKQRLVID